MKIKYIFTVLMITFLFIGCGGSKKQVAPTFVVQNDVEEDEEEVTTNGILIHGMRGAYPESYKGKILGDGLFDHVYFDIAKKIVSNIENTNKAIIINIKTKSKKPDLKTVVKEGLKYFKLHKDFKIASGVRASDVNIIVSEDGSLKFITVYENPDIFDNDSDQVKDMALTINEIADESTANWSKVFIEDINGNIHNYQIMKDPVTISEFNPKKSGNKPVTNINFSSADDYCFKTYNGYLSPLYVFEYALRQGSIESPRKGVSMEMISGYDEVNETDKVLNRENDIVSSDDEVQSDFSEIVVFNYKSKSYKFKRDNFVSKSVTFRCAK